MRKAEESLYPTNAVNERDPPYGPTHRIPSMVIEKRCLTEACVCGILFFIYAHSDSVFFVLYGADRRLPVRMTVMRIMATTHWILPLIPLSITTEVHRFVFTFIGDHTGYSADD